MFLSKARTGQRIWQLCFFSYHALLTLSYEENTAIYIWRNSCLANFISGKWNVIYIWHSLYDKALAFRILGLNPKLCSRAPVLSLKWIKKGTRALRFFFLFFLFHVRKTKCFVEKKIIWKICSHSGKNRRDFWCRENRHLTLVIFLCCMVTYVESSEV